MRSDEDHAIVICDANSTRIQREGRKKEKLTQVYTINLISIESIELYHLTSLIFVNTE